MKSGNRRNAKTSDDLCGCEARRRRERRAEVTPDPLGPLGTTPRPPEGTTTQPPKGTTGRGCGGSTGTPPEGTTGRGCGGNTGRQGVVPKSTTFRRRSSGRGTSAAASSPEGKKGKRENEQEQ